MLRFTSRLKYLNNNNLVGSRLNTNHQTCLKHSQPPKQSDVVVNRKPKYIVGALLTASALGFAWYVKREKELG